jgi:hypothetical protein
MARAPFPEITTIEETPLWGAMTKCPLDDDLLRLIHDTTELIVLPMNKLADRVESEYPPWEFLKGR